MTSDVGQEVMTLPASSRSVAITDARAYAIGITTRVCARLSRDLRRRREVLDALGRTLRSATREEEEEAPCEREDVSLPSCVKFGRSAGLRSFV